MDAFTKERLRIAARLAESSFDKAVILLAGSRWTLVLFVAWTLGAVAFGWWAGK